MLLFMAKETKSALLAKTVRAARVRGGVDVPSDLSVNELARRAGLSPSQVSRIETGKLLKPSRAILVALAHALNRNPMLLLVLAGHLSEKEAQAELRYFYRDGSEASQEWGSWTQIPLAEVRRLLFADSVPDLTDLRSIAADLFMIEETAETLWDDAYALATGGPGTAELRQLAVMYRGLSPEDRRLVGTLVTALHDRNDLAFQLEQLGASSADADGRADR